MTALAVVSTLCALTVTGLLVKRELFRPQSGSPAPQIIAKWRDYQIQGQRMGPAAAPVVIVEFSDFQCPACRILHDNLARVRKDYPDQVAVVFRHFPLTTIHPAARATAIASECAALQGSFEAMHDRFFNAQDSLLVLGLTQAAFEAGARDTVAFKRCLTSPEAVARLREDSIAATQLVIRGTPLVLFNDKLYAGAAPEASLREMIETALRADTAHATR